MTETTYLTRSTAGAGDPVRRWTVAGRTDGTLAEILSFASLGARNDAIEAQVATLRVAQGSIRGVVYGGASATGETAQMIDGMTRAQMIEFLLDIASEIALLESQ